MSPTAARCPRLLLVAGLALLTSCGYRPLQAALPGHPESVCVALPDAAAVGELALARELEAALVSGLARSGVAVTSCTRAAALLRSRIAWLRSGDALVDPARQVVAGQTLRMGLELRLEEAAGGSLWRSGLLEVEVLWALDTSDPVRSEASRTRALQSLARQAAEQALTLLYGQGQDPSPSPP